MNMTWDSGGAIILSSIITVLLMWIGNLVSKHFANNEEAGDSAHERITALTERISELAMNMVRHERHVAENYVKISAFERLEAKLDRLLERNGDHHG